MIEKYENIIEDLIKLSEEFSDSIAISDFLKSINISYLELVKIINNINSQLETLGIPKNEIIPIILPQDYISVITFLSLMKGFVCLPINNNFAESDFKFVLSKVNPNYLIVSENSNPILNQLANELEINIIRVSGNNVESGNFQLKLENNYPLKNNYINNDLAFILLTSATTGNPKLVPWTHQKTNELIRSITNISSAANNGIVPIFMPIFHLQAIVSIFQQLFTGGRIITVQSFEPKFLEQIIYIYKITQFTANPTLLKSVFEYYEGKDTLIFNTLRFVTSSGLYLNNQFYEEFSTKFKIPVIEGYGMSEAGRVTLLLPKERYLKSGSVGKIYDTHVAILTDKNEIKTEPNVEGEILLKGNFVIKEYFNDEEANKTQFIDGWLKSGDYGKFDEEGYLYLMGRTKDIINKGGEKIQPSEVEKIINNYQGVEDCVVFSYKHPRYVEDIGAYIQTKQKINIPDLRLYLSKYLANYKIPRIIKLVDKLPVGPTGKIQKNLISDDISNYRTEKTTRISNNLTKDIAAIWVDLLKTEVEYETDDFILLGGDSILAIELCIQMESRFGVNIDPVEIMLNSNLNDFAKLVNNKLGRKSNHENIVIIKNNGSLPPLFLFHLADGSLLSYNHLINNLRIDAPIFAIKLTEIINTNSLYDKLYYLSEKYSKIIKEIDNQNDFILCGYSAGGIIAYETARMLKSNNVYLFLIDALCKNNNPSTFQLLYHFFRFKIFEYNNITSIISSFVHYSKIFLQKKAKIALCYLNSFKKKNSQIFTKINKKHTTREFSFEISKLKLRPQVVQGTLFWGTVDDRIKWREDLLKYWNKITYNRLKILRIESSHLEIMNNDKINIIAQEINKYYEQISVKNDGIL